MSAHKFTIDLIIQKPLHEVYEAVHDPKQLSSYFTTNGASAPMIANTTVHWDFADFPGEFPVYVKHVERDKMISFEWQAQEAHGEGEHKKFNPTDYNTLVIFRFEGLNPKETKVSVTESGWKDTPAAKESAYMNCFGWSHMLCAMKAYLEHGINLRDGAFKQKY